MENSIFLIGEMNKDFEYSHCSHGENFYVTELAVRRESNTVDLLRCICSDRICDISKFKSRDRVRINGAIRTINIKDDDCTHLKLDVFILSIDEENVINKNDFNEGYLYGIICKCSYRVTPLGRQISDVILAINRPYGKTDYIPVICWGKNAKYINELSIGTTVRVNGRLQSRNYNKDGKKFTAYEFSTSGIEVIETETIKVN